MSEAAVEVEHQVDEQIPAESDIVTHESNVAEEQVPETEDIVTQEVYYPEYSQTGPWTLISSATREFENPIKEGFLKGCKWSPDGTCLLTCSDDDTLRFFDLPADLYSSHKTTYQGCSTTELTPSLRIKEGEIVYDYCWYPLMSSWNAETCL